MPKFAKKKGSELPPVSTASLPDIVFMLLFFFMTVTEMKDSDLMVVNKVPSADQVQRLDKKDPVVYIYAGKPLPKYQDKYGTNAKIQVNDKFADVSEIAPFILQYKDGLRQELREQFITALKVDAETNMGLISDIKEKLQDVNALKLTYITKEGSAIEKK
ncbi:ExbD/TolR family protein [Capnocytophaga canimorsus]|uniref:Membrane protein n=3 Tax=Capnocytophaga canimorsus TaxID=28188 RepID=F9YR30_CAPCC|nr:biopolymer transporter ExbD [Capnocytophaga canimorsus]AEK23640.1 Putative membrane protein [Capnocytophaga canimorsus Cc5]ATA76649.1 biopolymer transporter ExbD [Capnocytophaga canimorsus]ATA91262.1 biopolymer transporter ExbD [Capnocytophaga canimorsus]AWL78109.1 biopolymer transporter ExbD [Capnocytophaga canimorsus]AYW36745.1 biopolymer transporter ExbD [Capnocytophaga canimorsus]